MQVYYAFIYTSAGNDQHVSKMAFASAFYNIHTSEVHQIDILTQSIHVVSFIMDDSLEILRERILNCSSSYRRQQWWKLDSGREFSRVAYMCDVVDRVVCENVCQY